MALPSSPSLLFILLITATLLMTSQVTSQDYSSLDPAEQESVYRLLESVNPTYAWRILYPEDLCLSAPHGVVCDYSSTPHIVELSFGYVSDYSPNTPCSSNFTLDPTLLSSARFPNLRKLFFYKCFIQQLVSLPDFSDFSPSLEEIIFLENPSLVGSLSGSISNLTSLRRLVLTGSSVSGQIPDGLSNLVNLEQLTLSGNKFNGDVSLNFTKMEKLKVLDLSENGFSGNAPEAIGNLHQLLKLDLSFNQFSGQVPGQYKGLKGLEFLDLSYNMFVNGVPLFIGEMPRLREVHLSGNLLGGQIPEIWEKLGGINGIGLSGAGLVGSIPASMGVYLRNLCYLGLDNNKLEGTVPEEFGALELVNELNLENNSLSGKVPFSAEFASKVGKKLKLEGNSELCVDEGLRSAKISGSLGKLKLCNKPDIPQSALFYASNSSIHGVCFLILLLGFLLDQRMLCS